MIANLTAETSEPMLEKTARTLANVLIELLRQCVMLARVRRIHSLIPLRKKRFFYYVPLKLVVDMDT